MERKREPVPPSDQTEATLNEGTPEEKIRALAYQLFCESGCTLGHDQEHWLAAERLVLGIPETK